MITAVALKELYYSCLCVIAIWDSAHGQVLVLPQ